MCAGRDVLAALFAIGVWTPTEALATPAPEAPVPELCAERVTGPIRLDGDLSEPAWQQACRIQDWFETSPGDNVPPKVESLAYVAYDDRHLYLGFDLRDPAPRRIRAPLGDRDSLTGTVDHVGVLIDTRNDGRTASIFAASASGVQYDSIWDDVAGTDDTAPDFFWDAAARIDAGGWSLEMRIPFASLRYTDRNPAAWRIVFYRIYPREFWYQMQSTTIPRGIACWVCRSNRLTGLHDLPPGGGVVAAPYVSGRATSQTGAGPGTRLEPWAEGGAVGADVKWTPNASHAIDAALNPDFSHLEADVPQIAANERFALFYPEKRPFFLEAKELFSTPIQAIHTRTITSPEWGGRATGRLGATSYTVLVARDEGGGSVVLPSATGSAAAEQDFRSYAWIGRARRDFGRSFLSVLTSSREVDGGGHNRLVGPDFEWRPNLRDTVTGQWLVSRSETPQRPDLAPEWDGRHLSGQAGLLRWQHSTSRLDWTAAYKDVGEGFRADDGFVPQVGYRELQTEAGWTFWPNGSVRKVRLFGARLSQDRIGAPAADGGDDRLDRQLSVGIEAGGRWDSSARARLVHERILTGGVVLPRTQLVYDLSLSPSRWLSRVGLSGSLGDAIDFDDHRAGTGADVTLSAAVLPTDHLELRLYASRRFVDGPTPAQGRGRLLSARADRLKATYAFTRRSFVRVLMQYEETRRDPGLGLPVPRRTADFSGSALFAYKLNWQTVLFLGYGDERGLSDHDRLEPVRHELYLKVSYALQHSR